MCNSLLTREKDCHVGLKKCHNFIVQVKILFSTSFWVFLSHPLFSVGSAAFSFFLGGGEGEEKRVGVKNCPPSHPLQQRTRKRGREKSGKSGRGQNIEQLFSSFSFLGEKKC